MLALALVLALGQTPQHRLFQQPNLPNGVSYAFFEAFPASGAGTTTACSTTAPTGARGEVLTFTRGSNGTCTKTATGGLATTGIADGDLVVLSSNVARVEYDSAGTLGLLVESSRTNLLLRSQEIDNAAWVVLAEGGGTAASKGTANTGAAPDGTLTADPITFAATTATQGSFIYNFIGVSSSAAADSIYLKSTSGTCTLDLCEEWNSSVNTTCTSISINSTTWVRPSVVSPSTAGTNRYLIIGNASTRNGGVARAACTAYVWGGQYEVGAYATSYIPTTTIAVARSAESADFALAFAPPAGVCIAASLVVPSTDALVAGSGLWLPGLSGGALSATFASPYVWPYAGSTGGNLSIDSTGSSTVAAATGVAGAASARYRASFSGAWAVCRDATCSSGGASVWSSPTYTRLKLNAVPGVTTGAHLWSRIQVDPVATRCSP